MSDYIGPDHPDYDAMIDKLDNKPGCANCDAPVGGCVAFCGACGTENPGFDESKFEIEFAKSLREIQEEEECHSGHGPAMADKKRKAEFCIYCGQKYEKQKYEKHFF